MNKGIIIMLIIVAISGGIIGYLSKINVKAISEQVDLKSGNTHINWIIGTRSYCDTTYGDCINRKSSSGGSSWGGGGGGGK